MLMKRTQIYLDVNTFVKAKALARNQGKTISQIIRDALRDFVSKNKKSRKYNSLEMIAKLSKEFPFPKSAPKDLSFNLDHYLYGTPKKKLKKVK